jgi:tRNA A-37 threonylcarbamoyl transferase component Bud32
MSESISIVPGCGAALAAAGLSAWTALVERSSGTLVSRHASRDVLRFPLGDGWAFLKRQYRVGWRERLASWWAGFGWVSRSRREWRVLHALQTAGVGCPEPLAVGESADGRAFLLVNALDNAIDLPTYLGRENLSGEPGCLVLARRLGRTLAAFHRAGFTHPDLYAKHVFVHLADGSISFVDFQRTRMLRRVSWRQRWRDLAALDASLGEGLASGRERIACLAAYVRFASPQQWKRLFRRGLWAVMKQSARLLHKQRIRRLRAAADRPQHTMLFHRVTVEQPESAGSSVIAMQGRNVVNADRIGAVSAPHLPSHAQRERVSA